MADIINFRGPNPEQRHLRLLQRQVDSGTVLCDEANALLQRCINDGRRENERVLKPMIDMFTVQLNVARTICMNEGRSGVGAAPVRLEDELEHIARAEEQLRTLMDIYKADNS